MKWLNACLGKLHDFLWCQEHSKPGMPVYCLIEPSGERTKGGHHELTHEEMSLWAKHMVSTAKLCRDDEVLTNDFQSLGLVTKYKRPNINRFNHPPTKKARTTHATPEVHVSVNIAPAKEAGSSAMQATYVVLDSPSSAPGPSRPARDSELTSHQPLSTPLEPSHPRRLVALAMMAPAVFKHIARTRYWIRLNSQRWRTDQIHMRTMTATSWS